MRLWLLTSVIAALLSITQAHPLKTFGPIRASFYADKFEGRKTASGTLFHQEDYTVASLTLPLGTSVRITNTKNGSTVYATVTDRGPYSNKYSLDLSKACARELGITEGAGWGWVKVDVIAWPKPRTRGKS